MASWPNTVPLDLRARLEEVLGFRVRPTGQDVWGAVHEWLEAHEVKPPPNLRADAPKKTNE